MIDDPFVVLAATPRAWASTLHAHAADHGGIVVRATVLTDADARREQCDVLIVDDITSFLTPALVAAVHEAGRAVLGVFDADDPQGKGDLVDAGVDALVSADVDPDELVGTIRGLAGQRRVADPEVPAARVDPPARRDAMTIGVTGPTGGDGVSELAIEIAAVLGTTGRHTLLMDLDEHSPCHAQRLALALQPNLLGAIDATRRRADVTLGLHRLSRRHPLQALPGMTSGQDWTNVPRGAVGELAGELQRHRSRLVMDLGHCPEVVEGSGGTRFGHALGMARTCTDLVLVTAPTPIAIARTIELFSRVHPGPGAPHDGQRVHVVLNRVGKDRWATEEAIAELRRGLAIDVVHTVPEDRRVARAAWQGERVDRGRFCTAVARVVAGCGWAST